MAYERNWKSAESFDSYVAADAAELLKRRVWAIKAFLTGYVGGATLGLWTVAGSSDGVTAGMDGVDRLGAAFDPAKIVQGTAGSAHSWIVLFSPVMNGYQWSMCIDLNSATAGCYSVIFARSAFTGGTNAARPTSVDEWVPANGAALMSTAGLTQRLHGAISSTGDFFLWSARLGGGGYAEFFLAAIAPVGVHAADQFPLYTACAVQVSGEAPSQAFLGGATASIITRNGAAVASCYAQISFPSLTPAVDLLSGRLLDVPAWVMVRNVANTTLHARGRLPDMGVTPSLAGAVSCPTGSVIRDGANAIAYTTVGALIVPFDSAPDMT
jgi:hypothetical protein